MSLLKQDTKRKGQVDKALPERKKVKEFEADDNKEYEVEAIIKRAVYSQQTNNQMPSLYCFILEKGYPEKENT